VSKKYLIIFILFFVTFDESNASTLSVSRTDNETVRLTVSENADISAMNFSLQGAYIGEITVDAENKEAYAHRGNAIVYGLNSELIANGTNIDMRVKMYGKSRVQISGIVASTPTAQHAEAPDVQFVSPIESNNTRSVSRGEGQTVITKRNN
jgi:hypothetical protein